MKFFWLFFAGLCSFEFSALQAREQIQFAYCWGSFDNARICKQAEVLDDDFIMGCRAFAGDIGASSYGYRYSKNLDYLEQTMGQNCDEVRDGGTGEIYACMMGSYCEGDPSRDIKNLASRVYADSYERGVARCLDMNSSRVMREIQTQSAMGCYVKIELEVFEFNMNSIAE
ncbi:MAG: hypothetical protein AB8G05_22490 [Oligoflexales bacterium]